MATAAAEKSIERRREEREAFHKNNVLIADAGWCWMQRRHPGRTVDDLLCDPHEALKLVAHVRKQFPEADAYRVCKALMNARKVGNCNVRGKK